MNDPDVTRYDNANALGVYEGSALGDDVGREFTGYFRTSDTVDY